MVLPVPYSRRITRYLLLQLDFQYHDHAHRMPFGSPSVEHVLPQKPAASRKWRADFSDEQCKESTNRIQNSVLTTAKKKKKKKKKPAI
ncbi:GmrSD restriction endonuclease domain-containing protein [Paraburkholderia kirstenboschensis]|uniref:DUF1524 domain-containing protein n=1 Tax=Paraburkholderia kirstenboschensis TaxID=1245436 RepID=A0ABZ0EEK6_9BURK|nr:DUF1524 domain-containing protein [Paraburkholderia kirstenboschensis]WOD15663.1 DUF1524 domain-containing protein [Paraburkholderia kirstenboschensis]